MKEDIEEKNKEKLAENKLIILYLLQKSNCTLIICISSFEFLLSRQADRTAGYVL